MTDRRTYAREYARRKRNERWAAAAESETLCPRSLGNGHPCNYPLENRVVDRRTVPFCAQCDRKARGICIDCKTEPVEGLARKALRCALCKKFERAAAEDRWRKRHPGKVRQQWRARKRRLLADPVKRADELSRKKAWRLANPTRKKKYAKAYNRSESARAYQRAYRARKGAERASAERERLRRVRRGETVTHACVGCGAAIAGRPKKCEDCRARSVRAGRAVLFAHAEAAA